MGDPWVACSAAERRAREGARSVVGVGVEVVLLGDEHEGGGQDGVAHLRVELLGALLHLSLIHI